MTEQTNASRTKRVNLTTEAPAEINNFTLMVSAEVIGTDEVITYSVQTPTVSPFFASALVAGIKERFATVIASAAGDAAVIVEKLRTEVEALNAGLYASRTRGGSVKSEFINTVVAMAFVALFGKDVRVNEDNFKEVIGNLDALQAADEAYQALSKEEKASAVASYSKVAAGISYFKSALAE